MRAWYEREMGMGQMRGGVFGAAVGMGLTVLGVGACSRSASTGQDSPGAGGGRTSAEMIGGTASDATPSHETPAGGTEVAGQGAGELAAEADERYVLGVSMNRIDGQTESLEAYKGKVVLVVNVASACGLTPQYEALQALYAQKSGEGLVVLGFPANNFGNQEPGTNAEILEFCSGRYEVTFPMFEKISVTGEDQHPLYARLSQEGGPPDWNFTKYLVDRQGRVVARFSPRTSPSDPALLARVDELLGQ